MLDDLFYRLRVLFQRNRFDDELDDELAFHLEREAEKLQATGLSAEEARRRARVKLGGAEKVRQQVREGRGTALFDDLLRDIIYALRQLVRSPFYTFTALATLALAIGAAMTMASVVHTVLLAPLPFSEPTHLVGLGFAQPEEQTTNKQTGATAQFLLDHAKSFSSASVYTQGTTGANLSIAGDGGSREAIQVGVQAVDRNFFPTFAVTPELGRNFTADEDRHNGPRAVILSHALWRRVFNGDHNAVGRVLHLNGESAVIVGVMPESFSFSSDDRRSLSTTSDLWQPLRLDKSDSGYAGTNYNMLARLRDGATIQQAQQELTSLNQQLISQEPYLKRWIGVSSALPVYLVRPLSAVMAANVRSSIVTLTAAAIAVLLVACLNLAGLNAARASRRQKEITLRSALGASRLRIVRLLIAESLLLAVAGAALGIAVSVPMLRLLLANSPIPITRAGASFAAVATLVVPLVLLVTLLCGLAPSWLVLRHNTASRLQAGHSVGATASDGRIGRILLVSQTALAVVLLSAAALLLTVFLKLRSTPLGVEAESLSIAQVNLRGAEYNANLATTQFIDKVLTRLEQSPGVKRAAAINGLLLDRGLNIIVTPPDHGKDVLVELRLVSSGYFSTVGTPLLAGREITADDRKSSRAVVVVSQAFARRFWPDKDPAQIVGLDYRLSGDKNEAVPVIVGVVGDAHSHSLAEPPAMLVYEPFTQQDDKTTKALNNWFRTSFAIRTQGNIDIAAIVDHAIRDADQGIPISRITTMQAMIDHSLAQPRFFSSLVSAFAAFAVLLTIIGLFGLLSYQVAERTREIGVRIALGATRGNVLSMILRRGLVLTLFGLTLGAAISLVLPRLLRSLLDSNIMTAGTATPALSWNTVTALALAAAIMTAAAALASYLPARRAANIEPLEALRTE